MTWPSQNSKLLLQGCQENLNLVSCDEVSCIIQCNQGTDISSSIGSTHTQGQKIMIKQGTYSKVGSGGHFRILPTTPILHFISFLMMVLGHMISCKMLQIMCY